MTRATLRPLIAGAAFHVWRIKSMDPEPEAVQGGARSGIPTRATVVAVSAVIFLVLLLTASYFMSYTDLVTCGGDGGSPYAAPASPRGQYCDAGIPRISIGGGLLLAVAGSAVAARRRRWWPVIVCGFAAAALIASPATFGVRLSGECADEPQSPIGDELYRYMSAKPECSHY
jgi:hypothetical protein